MIIAKNGSAITAEHKDLLVSRSERTLLCSSYRYKISQIQQYQPYNQIHFSTVHRWKTRLNENFEIWLEHEPFAFDWG